MTSPPGRAPLDGVVVVDLSRHLPGPLVSRLLGDLGARVIKVEEPREGDPSRQAPPFASAEEESGDGSGKSSGSNTVSSLAAILLSGHESLALDLEQEDGRRALEDLLMHADVLLESFRPGRLKRFGLDPAELRQLYPDLVICSVSGWGQEGEHAWRAGHDLTYQALAGTLAAGGGMPAVQVADVLGAWSAATAISAALYRRETLREEDRGKNGGGCWIDQALLDAAGHGALTAWAAEADGPKGVGEPLMLTGAYPCYDLYRTKDDGTLALALLEPKFWRAFCKALGRKKLVARQFSRKPKARQEVAKIVRSRTREEWAEFFADHDLPAEPVLSLSEARRHPQVRARGLVHEAGDGILRLGYPAKIDGERPRGGEGFPHLGEHTDRLVQEFGLATDVPAAQRRKKGIGRRRSVKAWAKRVATRVAAGLSRKTGSGDDG